jgi:hypothetical protein
MAKFDAGRGAVQNALIDAGGDYMAPGLPEVVAALYVGTTTPDGKDVDVATLPLPEIWDALAKMPNEMTRVIGEAKAAFPDLFIDVSRLERIKSPTERTMQKTLAISRARDERRSVGHVLDEWKARQAHRKSGPLSRY